MPLQATSGAASYDAFGGGVAAVPTYIESCFSTFLYTGNGSTQTITNGIDLAGKGGMFWGKNRGDALRHWVIDSSRAGRVLFPNLTDAEGSGFGSTSPFTSSGLAFTASNAIYNGSANSYVGWTFRKQPKFFDVVTYTGNGTAGRTVAHSLNSVPGCIIIKRTDSGEEWVVYHRSLGTGKYMRLSSTAAEFAVSMVSATSTTNFTLTSNPYVNDTGGTYVAYLFAHDAGGFGLTGTDNVITCGSFTTNGSGAATVSLGYEPQWIMIKCSDNTSGWSVWDTMRGLPVGGDDAYLFANSSAAEATFNNVDINATGFNAVGWGSSSTYIYIAIRRGPMKTPTTGTSVFDPEAVNGSTAFTTNFPVDLAMFGIKAGSVDNFMTFDRLRGSLAYLKTSSTAAEGTTTSTYETVFDNNTGSNYKWWSNTSALAGWNFRRAPGFFDVVCYTGTGSATTVNHNLGVAPELIITKMRSSTRDWGTGWASLGWTARGPALNSTETSFTTSLWWNNTAPTSTVFTVGTSQTTNGSGSTYVAYLFASCPGVSKVGSYTGNGSSQTIDCGFTGGARFVMIKRTDSTGNWMVVDTARGLVSASDPTLYLNSTAAEVTGVDWLDPDNSGFIVNQESTMNANVSSATYIYLSIA